MRSGCPILSRGSFAQPAANAARTYGWIGKHKVVASLLDWANARNKNSRERSMPSLDEERRTQGQLKVGIISFDGSGIDCLVRKNVGLWRKSRGRKPNRHSQLIRLGYRHRAQQSPLSRCLAKGASDRYRVRLRPENPADMEPADHHGVNKADQPLTVFRCYLLCGIN